MPAYDVRPVEFRKVTADCHFSSGGTRYSTPPQASGHTVTVRPSGEHTGDLFAVYLGDDLLAEHRLAPKGIKTVTLPAHAEAIRCISYSFGEGVEGEHSSQWAAISSIAGKNGCTPEALPELGTAGRTRSGEAAGSRYVRAAPVGMPLPCHADRCSPASPPASAVPTLNHPHRPKAQPPRSSRP